jgi:hypothetical protein
MATMVVEYARFVEVRQRRARIAEELIQPARESPVVINPPASNDDRAVDPGASRSTASATRDAVDVR